MDDRKVGSVRPVSLEPGLSRMTAVGVSSRGLQVLSLVGLDTDFQGLNVELRHEYATVGRDLKMYATVLYHL
jgi:hypothetical protein